MVILLSNPILKQVYMKKLYNNKLMHLILALFAFSFIGCQEFDIDSQEQGPLSIEVDALDSYIALATSPSNIVFNISSNTPWKVSSNEQWCKVSPAMSSASSLVSEIVVELEPNQSDKQRVATLTIEADNIETKKTITITQVSKESLVVIPYDEIVSSDGEEISFNIVSNKPWKIIPSTQFLESIDKTSGEGNESGEKETIKINISENPTARREGSITVKTDFDEFTFTITQDGVVIEQEEPSETGTIDFGHSETEKIVKVRSNREWKVTVPSEYSDWITAEALNSSELKITLKESNRLVTRSGSVLLSTVDIFPGFEDVSFEITQRPMFWFSGNADNYVKDEATNNLKVIGSGSNVVSHYTLKKGSIAIEFEEMNLTGAARLVFNMWPPVGNTNFHFWLRSDADAQFTCGGSGFAWEQLKFPFTTEEVNAIRKIEFFVEDDPDNYGKVRIRLAIDGVDKGILSNKDNPYVTDPSGNPGQNLNIQPTNFDPGNYFVVKSITHTPAE